MNKRELICPAIYKHFKHDEYGIPNNYIYATMFVSKPLKNYHEELNKMFNHAGVYLLTVQLTEKERSITLFAKDDQYYHDPKDSGVNLVIYKSLYDAHIPYARPLNMFLSEVDREKYPREEQRYRFELVKD